MRGANDGLWDWDLETDEVYYSPRWKSMLGYDENELESNLKTWESLVHPEDKERALTKVRDYLDGRTESFEVEMCMHHKQGHEVFVLSRGFKITREADGQPIRLVGTHVDITEQRKSKIFDKKNTEILRMIAVGRKASDIYDEIALMYESRHPDIKCSMLELHGNILIHGGAASLEKDYCDAVNGIENGPHVGSCGTSTYTGKRVFVENIGTDPKWDKLRDIALRHGLHSCWSEPIKRSSGEVLGAFGMYKNHPALPSEEEKHSLKSAARLASIVMERDHDQQRIKELAYRDQLTGLPNRTHFYQNLEEIINTTNKHKQRFGLLYIDIDDFKGINDSLGHDIGDLYLKTISERLSKSCRDVDFIALLSGDEFCILARDIDDYYAIVGIAHSPLDVISQPVELSARKLMPACSIGIAHYPDDGNNISELLKAADTALYEAKENGKNKYAFYKPELSRKVEYRFQIEQSLREAIDNQELSLMYQPKVDLLTGGIVGFEALSRWEHPQLGVIPPVDFIEIAEKIGMIKPLTEWALNTACQQAVDWKNAGFPVMNIAVNISPSHFLDESIVPLVKDIIRNTGIHPEDLELEVTENIVQIDPRNLAILKKLKSIGVKLAIDDFGTGYSSIASLKHLQVDFLKIDKCFIDDMLRDKDTQILVNTMINMGHQLGYGIIAEGVQSVEQYQKLKELGCERAQGYWFSKPLKAKDVSLQTLNENVANEIGLLALLNTDHTE